MNRILTVSFALVCLVGCNSQPQEKVVVVRGRVTSAGAPLQVSGRDVGLGRVEIAFHQVQPDGTPATEFDSASADEQGNFNIRGRDGKGLKPGKYRIVVRQWDPDPTDKLDGKFSLENSQIEREIGESDNTIEIDVAKPTG